MAGGIFFFHLQRLVIAHVVLDTSQLTYSVTVAIVKRFVLHSELSSKANNRPTAQIENFKCVS